jgi:hypothetical protein
LLCSLFWRLLARRNTFWCDRSRWWYSGHSLVGRRISCIVLARRGVRRFALPWMYICQVWWSFGLGKCLLFGLSCGNCCLRWGNDDGVRRIHQFLSRYIYRVMTVPDETGSHAKSPHGASWAGDNPCSSTRLTQVQ